MADADKAMYRAKMLGRTESRWLRPPSPNRRSSFQSEAPLSTHLNLVRAVAAAPHRRKELSDIELEWLTRLIWMPDESIVDEHPALIVGMPHLEGLGLTVYNPIRRHAIPLECATLRDSIVSRRSRRHHLADEKRPSRRIVVRRSAGHPLPQNVQVRLIALAFDESQLARTQKHLAQP